MAQASDVLTKVLAFWGAILSSIGLGWNLYRDLHDRGRLKVEADVRRIVMSPMSPNGRGYSVKPDLPVEGASEQVYVRVSVTNIGRRPKVWEGWGGKHLKPVNGKEGFVIIPLELPKKLQEGETHTEFTPELIAGAPKISEGFSCGTQRISIGTSRDAR